jgi:hypothetical protein
MTDNNIIARTQQSLVKNKDRFITEKTTKYQWFFVQRSFQNGLTTLKKANSHCTVFHCFCFGIQFVQMTMTIDESKTTESNLDHNIEIHSDGLNNTSRHEATTMTTLIVHAHHHHRIQGNPTCALPMSTWIQIEVTIESHHAAFAVRPKPSGKWWITPNR